MEINAANFAEATATIWDAWLKLFFNGESHLVCGTSLFFPAAQIAHGASNGDVQTPADGLIITIVLEDGFNVMSRVFQKGNGGKDHIDECAWWLFFRAKVGPAGQAGGKGNSRYLARQAYDRFRGLMDDPNTNSLLGAEGIFVLGTGQGRPDENTDYATWTVRVRGRVEYEW